MAGISHRTYTLGTENAFVVLAEVKKRLRAGEDIINFCIGQPDFDTPDNIKQAAITAINEGKSGYTPSRGITELREAVANYFSRTRGIQADPEHVAVACGGKPFIYWSILSTTDSGVGDEVIYPNPGFPIYESQIKANDTVPVPTPLLEENKFSFSIDDLNEKISSKTKLLILNSPQNPTGSLIPKHDLEEIAKLAIEHDFWVYSDEVYSTLVYDDKFESISAIPGMEDHAILVDCVSKSHAMTGWRLGYAHNPKLAPHFARWMTNTDSCAPHHVQWAAVEALNGPQEVSQMMTASFKERRDLIIGLLNDIDGVSCLTPGGAFYAWPNVTEACKKVGAKNSEEFRRMLLDKGVAALADVHFGGKNPGVEQEYIRFSYATSKEGIVEGMKRMKEFVEG
ncbi:MAG: pyridoxal phosphate-dependent aminotransferase [archaeon]